MTSLAAAGLALGLSLALGLWLVTIPLIRLPAAPLVARVRAPLSIVATLERAGLPSVGLGGFVTGSLIVGIAVAVVTFALTDVIPLGFSAGAAAAALPFVVVRRRARSRHKAARVVWPDVVDHLVSAIRSGHALADSVISLADAGPVETRSHFEKFAADYRSTGNFGLCLTDLKDSLADPVADRIIETLRMSREVGGSDLTLVLRDLARYLRKDAAVRSEVEARQSWVINAARLGVAAPWIVLGLLSTRPEAAAAYNTPTGAGLILVGLAVSVLAYRVMLALGRLPTEQRWFR